MWKRAALEYLLNAGKDPAQTIPEELVRIRFITSTSYILILFGLILTAFHALEGLDPVAWIIGTGMVLGMLNLYTLFKYTHYKCNAQTMVALVFLVALCSNILWGGYYDPNFFWLMLMPILAALAIGFRAMMVYVVLIMITVIAFIILQNQGVLPLHKGQIPHYEIATLLNRFGLLAIICLVVEAFYNERIRYENELHESSRNARIANQEKNEFMATITHEIRAPLGEIIRMTELMMKTNQSSDQEYFSRMIHQSGESLIRLVNDAIDFAKMEAGKLRLEASQFNLKQAIENIVSYYSEQAYEKKIEFNYYIPPDLPQILVGDESRYKQVLSNLLSNAIKFTEKGEVNLMLSYDLKPDNNMLITAHVQDTGIGISKARLSKIFQSFSHSNSSLPAKLGGTRLGLTISQRLTHLMNGKITVDSELGKGSDFAFTCLLKIPDTNSETVMRPLSHPLTALCIGLIESDKELISHEMEKWNIHCMTTNTGVIGINMVQERIQENRPIDFIFIEHIEEDHPEFIELCEILSQQNHKTHIIELHKQSDSPNPNTSKFGLIHHLQKPIVQSELNAIVLAACGSGTNIPTSIIEPAQAKKQLSGHILIAEDNVINQALIKTQLDNLSISCDIVLDGGQALQAIQNKKYDLIIMDCHMGLMDGITTTQVIRKSTSSFQHIPIIALTANSKPEDRNRCISAGMNDFIVKPIQQIEFQQTLTKWLKVNNHDK